MRFAQLPSQSDQLLIRSRQQQQSQLQPIQQVYQLPGPLENLHRESELLSVDTSITYYQFPKMEQFERHLSDLGPMDNIIAFVKKPTVIFRLISVVKLFLSFSAF